MCPVAQVRRTKAEGVNVVDPPVAGHDVVVETAASRRILSHPGDDRPDHRMVIHESIRLLRNSPGEDPFVARIMVGRMMVDRANHRELVGALGVPRQVFAQVQSGNLRGDWTKLSPVRGRRVGFQIVRLHVRRATGQPDQDHRRVRGRTCRRG